MFKMFLIARDPVTHQWRALEQELYTEKKEIPEVRSFLLVISHCYIPHGYNDFLVVDGDVWARMKPAQNT